MPKIKFSKLFGHNFQAIYEDVNDFLTFNKADYYERTRLDNDISQLKTQDQLLRVWFWQFHRHAHNHGYVRTAPLGVIRLPVQESIFKDYFYPLKCIGSGFIVGTTLSYIRIKISEIRRRLIYSISDRTYARGFKGGFYGGFYGLTFCYISQFIHSLDIQDRKLNSCVIAFYFGMYTSIFKPFRIALSRSLLLTFIVYHFNPPINFLIFERVDRLGSSEIRVNGEPASIY
eukprot:TRINITY_DN1377_c1_g1_i1.p1 TRINITY_DN1377_c1_g1~~TRINITY_DN1377_c1_g1_i1.p1  ORF type:complete len:260 (-),score=29.71 TRINITY_DN1377_c1_g1_i1:262-951(-)